MDKLVIEYDFTVQLTPIYNGNKLQLYTSKVENNKFMVYSDSRNCEFYWLVHAKRCDIVVEPLKASINIKGTGPYKWI